jgi:hypothetical protein
LSASGFDDKLAFGFGPGPAIIHFLAISSVLRFGRATDRDTTNQPLLFIFAAKRRKLLDRPKLYDDVYHLITN